MNVFHKVLLKVHEISGGKENADVDLIDLLKKEGFYSNIDNIAKQLQDEGWVTETSRRYTVRITHWGNSEAKRVLSDSPDKVNEREKESSRLLNQGREMLILLEEFAAGPTTAKLDNIAKHLSAIAERSKKIRGYL